MTIKIKCLICFRQSEDRYSVMKRKYRNNGELGLGESRHSRIIIGKQNEIKTWLRESRCNENADMFS